MAVEKEWLNFFRDQYPVGSQIRLRELENPEGGFTVNYDEPINLAGGKMPKCEIIQEDR